MKKRLITLLGFSAMATAAVACVLGTSGNFGKTNIAGVEADTFAYDAASVTTRRIYFVNNEKDGNYWYQGYELSAQVWYGETYSGFVNATEIYGNYYYCVDFESDVVGFLGGNLHFELRAKTGEGVDDYAYTKTCYNIPALNNKAFDVVYIDNGIPVIGSTVGVGENMTIIACVLDHYATCTPSYASGYNGYPQLYKDFIEPNKTVIDANNDATKCEEGTVGINTKIAKLEQQYSLTGWTI